MAKYDTFSREELLELLQKQDKELALKKYGLAWDSEKEPEQVVVDCAKKLPILKNIQEKDIKTNDDDYNIMIEGDNYHALQVLNYTHKEKIDVIYIDPPYNTGNKDFVYNDKFVDKEDGYRHSKWLNFMEKRLELAKELLADTGVIFISIDDNEQANLKLLCDKIFGEDYFVANLHIETSVIAGPRRVPAMQGSVVKTAEYVLCYTKNKDTKIFKTLLYDYIPGYDTHYSLFFDVKNNKTMALVDFLKKNDKIKKAFDKAGLRVNLDNLWKLMCIDQNVKSFVYSDAVSENIFRLSDKTESVPKEVSNKVKANSIFIYDDKHFIKTNDGTIKGLFRYKDRIGPTDDYFSSYGERTVRGNLWKGFSADGGNLAKEGGVNFKSGKKPIRLIKQLIKGITGNLKKDVVVLDFFAGSGTTAEAVLTLNKEDGGKRKFIVCTNNENGIAENVTLSRIRNVMTGIKPDGKKYSNVIHSNLKYFKTDFVNNSKNTTQTKINLAKECSEMICLKTGRFNQINCGSSAFKIFSNNTKDQYTCIYFDCFDTDMHSFITEIQKLNGKKDLYIFSLTDSVDNSLFNGIPDTNVEAIPYKILDLYRRIAKAHIKGSDND